MVEDQTPTRVTEAINQTLELMKSGNLPNAIALVLFPVNNRPFSTWSLFNRMNVLFDYQFQYQGKFFEGDKFNLEAYNQAIEKIDYRGFRMWEKVGRHVNKGESAHAFILAPLMKKGKREYWNNATGSKHYTNKANPAPQGVDLHEEEYNFVKGFKGVAVFEMQQTNGKEVVFKKLELPTLQYKEIADFLKIKVMAVEGNKDYYGAFSPNYNYIKLATPECSVFFHELSHAVDNYIGIKTGRGGLKGGQDLDQEVVAEFSAAVLSRIVGIKIEQSAANMKKYVEHYAGAKDSEKTIIRLISRIEKVLDFITNFKGEKSVEVQAKEAQGKSENITPAEKLADKPDSRTVAPATADLKKVKHGNKK